MPTEAPTLLPGQMIARGVCRHLRALDFACLTEVTLTTGLRVDVMALGRKGEVWIVECKSSRADFTSDAKWPGYLGWADRFFFAVPVEFPADLLPADTGLMRADAWDADLVRMAPADPLPGARRKALTLRFARLAALRAQAAADPALTVSS